jgi:hypothetical protein
MITNTAAADAVNYLVAAGALSPIKDMDAVWADYVNAEIPDVEARELLPAARRAIRDWAREGRAWKVDVGRYVTAIRVERSDRVTREIQANGQLIPEGLGDHPVLEAEWKHAALSALGRGATREQAQAAAWHAVGVRQLIEEPPEHHDTAALTRQIGASA